MVDGLRPARLSELKAGMTIVAREVGDCLPDGMHTVCRAPEGFFVPCGSGRHMLDTVLEGGDTLPGFWIAPDLPVPQDGILAAWLDAAGDPGGAPPDIIDAVEDVLLERRRQILEKGRTPEQDDATYGSGDAGSALSMAGAAYALAASRQGVLANRVHPAWPGGIKPLGYRAGLVRAAAFILADIERIDPRGGACRGGGLMADNKLTCTAHVKLTISIQHQAHWSADTTVSQVHQAAKREVLAAFTRLIGESDLKIGIMSDPIVSILSTEQGRADNG